MKQPKKIPVENKDTDQLLEHILVKGHDNAGHSQAIAENHLQLDNNHAEHHTALMENGLQMQDKTVSKLDEIKQAIEKPKPEVQKMQLVGSPSEAMSAFFSLMKGEKGDKGDQGEKGIQGEKGDQGIQGLVGAAGKDGTDGKDGVPGAKGERGLDGTDGKDGLSGAKGETGPAGKDATEDPEVMAEMVNPHIDFTKIKNVPEFKKGMWAGTGYLREISDVDVVGVQDKQSIRWNASTSHWEAYTPSSGGGAYTPPSLTIGTSPSAGVYETGDSISSIDLSSTTTKGSDDITSFVFNRDGSPIFIDSSPAAGGGVETFTDPTPVTSDTTYQAVVGDGTTSVPASTSFLFRSAYYYGVASPALDITADGGGLTKLLIDDTATVAKQFSPSTQVYYFAYPDSYAALTSILDTNGFETIDDWTVTTGIVVTNSLGQTNTYRLYEFNNLTTQINFTNTFKQ